MIDSVTKPVVTAGFFIFTVLISLSGPVRSQGYIDLEAEREAACIVLDFGAETMTCPACLTSFPTGPRECPDCGLFLG